MKEKIRQSFGSAVLRPPNSEDTPQRAEVAMTVSNDGRSSYLRVSNSAAVTPSYHCELLAAALAAFIMQNGGNGPKCVAILAKSLENAGRAS